MLPGSMYLIIDYRKELELRQLVYREEVSATCEQLFSGEGKV